MQSFLTALLNTLMGMGTVFVVLIFISLIISLFRYVPKIEQNCKNKNKKEEEEISDEVSLIIRQVEENEELVEDEALVAVITAAIMAYRGQETASADRLVVRSVRRVRHSERRRRV